MGFVDMGWDSLIIIPKNFPQKFSVAKSRVQKILR